MKNYVIAKQTTINNIQLYLLNVSKNIKQCNLSIIPKNQLDEIGLYKFKLDSDKRLLARSFLYEYLSMHYHINNFELNFNEYKKPFLKSAPTISFSFSYAKDYLVVGISAGKKIGVDVEYIDQRLKIMEIAPEIMCSAELKQFNMYADNSFNKLTYFFRLFSGKESIIKSFGTGLYFDVKKLDTSTNFEFGYNREKFILHHLDIWMNRYTIALCYQK